MKKIKLALRYFIVCFLVSVFSVSLARAQQFEGIIHYKFSQEFNENTPEMAYMVKNSKIRIQFNSGNEHGAMLYLPADSTMIVLIDKVHSYIKMNTNQFRNDDNYKGKWENSHLDKTGQMKTIAGYKCEVWKVSNNDGDQLTMCMAKGLGTFMTPGNPMNNKNAPDWAREIIKKGYMPLEVVKEEGGHKTTEMQATKIEKKSLDASLFKIPDGYRDMTSMMQGVMNKNKH